MPGKFIFDFWVGVERVALRLLGLQAIGVEDICVGTHSELSDKHPSRSSPSRWLPVERAYLELVSVMLMIACCLESWAF